MPTNEPLFIYTRVAFSFTIWPNRIEVEETKGLLRQKTRTTILLKQVAAVEAGGLPPQLTIRTTDNAVSRYQLGTRNEEARQVLVELL
jgi:hypothetical protein